MSKEILIDTNVLLGLILKDNQPQLNQIKELLEQAEMGQTGLNCKSISIFEVIFVLLGKSYELEKSEIVAIIKILLNIPVINFEEVDILNAALDIFLNNGISIIDSFLISSCILKKQDFFSFDKKASKTYKELVKK